MLVEIRRNGSDGYGELPFRSIADRRAWRWRSDFIEKAFDAFPRRVPCVPLIIPSRASAELLLWLARARTKLPELFFGHRLRLAKCVRSDLISLRRVGNLFLDEQSRHGIDAVNKMSRRPRLSTGVWHAIAQLGELVDKVFRQACRQF